MSNDNHKLLSTIRNKTQKIICINDADLNIDFEKSRNEINKELEKAFPNKCNFEI